MELIILIIFLFMLTVVPMCAFFMIRRVFRIFRFIPNLLKEIIIPSYEEMSEQAESIQSDSKGSNKVKLSEQQLNFIKDSFVAKQIEFNPKKFRSKTKKKISIGALIVGLPALIFVLYKLFWVIYDFLVLTYF